MSKWKAMWDSKHEEKYYSHFIRIETDGATLLLFASDPDERPEQIAFGHTIARALNEAGALPPRGTTSIP